MYKRFFSNLFKHQKHPFKNIQTELIYINGNTIEYCKFGQGTPLILIMGYAATIQGWDVRFLHELAKSHQVVVYNNRNIGKSNFKSQECSISELANDVELLRQGLRLDTIALAGISMGGIIAQNYANLYPQNITHLILINTIPPGGLIYRPNPEVENILRTLSKGNLLNYWKMLKLLFPSTWQLFLLIAYHFKPKGSKNTVPKATILQQQNMLEQWSNYPNPKNMLKQIISSTLILTGGADQIIHPNNSEILVKYIRNSSLNHLPDGGHIMIFQYPQFLAKEIKEFIIN